MNKDQQDYCAYLSTLQPEAKCWCGWYPIGTCPHCPDGKSAADKVRVWCPTCHSDPGPDGAGPIVHRIGCKRHSTDMDSTKP